MYVGEDHMGQFLLKGRLDKHQDECDSQRSFLEDSRGEISQAECVESVFQREQTARGMRIAQWPGTDYVSIPRSHGSEGKARLLAQAQSLNMTPGDRASLCRLCSKL